ncbi:hypothetical protein C8Q78DRAFT_502219 [Trametes maxima]|nr:hypothetical protein C8Q78DRAFT_502219 [Trametes maxima]
MRRASRTSQRKRPAYLHVGADSDLEGDENINAPPPTPQGRSDDRQPSPPGEAVAESSGTSGGSVATDSFRTEYHPRSGRPTTVHPIEEFTRVHDSQYKPPPQETPWGPFTTKADFEFAELSLQAALNKRQVDAFLQLIERLVRSEDRLTFRNQKDVETAWKGAAHKLTPFKKHVITVEYKTPRNHDVYCRDLWEWAVDLLSDAYLVSHMDFDAMKLSRFDGKEWILCYDEPATARIFWEIQSRLPPGAKPFGIILYADKTKLSSFGTTKGYPVIARCANLPADIRNGKGLGGGRVVGWLPVIDEEPAHKGKAPWVDYKRIVWHKSFEVLLGPIRSLSRTGYHLKCGDHIIRHLFPFVAILSADYEEQCFMSLIRGLNSLYGSCPVCLVPADENGLMETWNDFPPRTQQEAQQVLAQAAAEDDSTESERILKAWGIRNIQNAFWEIQNSDPYQALSFDRLHTFHLGLFGHHLWKQFKKHVNALSKSRDAAQAIDDLFASFPRWSGYSHFPSGVMTMDYTDGTKMFHIALTLLFVAHHIITPTSDPSGYILLCVIRAFIDFDMHVGFELHDDKKIENGEAFQSKYSKLLVQYDQKSPEDLRKSWNFPKSHIYKHVFSDIRAKGAERNFNTKPNEREHGPLKKAYMLRTNYRDVAEQILNIDHCCYVAALIRDQIDTYEEALKSAKEQEADEQDSYESPYPTSIGGQHFSLGSPLSPPSDGTFHTLQQLETRSHSDSAFIGFRKRLGQFLNKTLPLYNIPLPNGQKI